MMKGLVRLTIAGCLLSGIAGAQRGGGMAGGHPGMPPPGGHGARPAQPGHALPAYGHVRQFHEDGYRGWNAPFLSAAYPAFWAPWVSEPWPAQSGQGTILFMMAPAAPAAPEPPPVPPAPVQAQTREYSWPKSSADSAPTFAIVLNDGTVRRAVTTCRQQSVLTYVAPDGAAAEVEISKVDREATRQANSRDLLE